jgi:hypothetical protein
MKSIGVRVRWLIAAFAAVSLCLVSAQGGQASTETLPRPFKDAYRDGYTWTYWSDGTPEQIGLALDRIARTGVKHLQIPYWGCQTDIHSSDVGACQMEMRERLGRVDPGTLARLAKSKGFGVTFLPIVLTPDWKWRGFFDPTDVAGWFRSYGVWIGKIAREAQALGLSEFVISTETTQLYHYEDRWKKLVAELRSQFRGPLILTVNWGDEEHSFWADVDAIGVSAYYPLSVLPDPTQEELDSAWRAQRDHLLALSRKWNRPIHITEVGYTSTTAAARTPWDYTVGQDISDFALQSRCFEAFRKAWENQTAMVRATVWATEMGNPSSGTFPFSFETLDKPAEGVLREFFANRSHL